MKNPVTRIRASVRELGYVDALVVALSRAISLITLRRILVRRCYIFVQPLADVPAIPRRRGASIVVRRIERGDQMLKSFPRPADDLQARFEMGAECIVAEVDGKLAGFLWFAIGSCVDPETSIRFKLYPPDTRAWDFDIFVADQFRGSAVFYRLWSHLATLLTQRGVRSSASLVWAHNPESIRSHRRLGAFVLSSAIHICSAEWSIYITDVSPYFRWYRPDRAEAEFDLTVPATL